MFFRKYILQCLLFSFVYSKHHPFDSSQCTECIEKFNYLHSHNKSLIDAVDSVISLCEKYNISFCRNITDTGMDFLEQSSDDICRELGYCDVMGIENFVFDTTILPGYKVKLYTYYDLLIAFEETSIISPPIINFTQKWSIKLEEPIEKELFNYITINSILYNPSSEDNYRSCGSCSGDEYLLKMGTEKYIYYVNITNGLILYKYRIENMRNLKSSINNFIYPNKNIAPQIFISDTNFNGSLFLTSMLFNASLSKCNTDKGLWDCQQNSILSIKTEKVKIEMPEEKPRCGTALEIFCPHENLDKEKCLNCLINNRENLIMCDISTEKNWCDLIFNF